LDLNNARKIENITIMNFVSIASPYVPYTGVIASSLLKTINWSQWPLGLRHHSAAARLLRSWARIPPWAWMSVCCEFCVLSGRGFCDELITNPEESYRLLCVIVPYLENLVNEEAIAQWGGAVAPKTNKQIKSIGILRLLIYCPL
jgi:hypothetical protein